MERARLYERILLSFIFHPFSFLDATRKRKTGGLACSCFTTTKVKGRCSKKGAKGRGGWTRMEGSVFSATNRRPRGHGPLYTKIRQPTENLLICLAHPAAAICLVFTPNLVDVLLPNQPSYRSVLFVLISVLLLPWPRGTFHGSMNGSYTGMISWVSYCWSWYGSFYKLPRVGRVVVWNSRHDFTPHSRSKVLGARFSCELRTLHYTHFLIKLLIQQQHTD